MVFVAIYALYEGLPLLTNLLFTLKLLALLKKPRIQLNYELQKVKTEMSLRGSSPFFIQENRGEQ